MILHISGNWPIFYALRETKYSETFIYSLFSLVMLFRFSQCSTAAKRPHLTEWRGQCLRDVSKVDSQYMHTHTGT